MKFLSVRELRNNLTDVWRQLSVEGELVITSNGQPMAILAHVDADSMESSLKAWRQVRVKQAVEEMQLESVRRGNDTMTMEEIDAEISASRRSRNYR